MKKYVSFLIIGLLFYFISCDKSAPVTATVNSNLDSLIGTWIGTINITIPGVDIPSGQDTLKFAISASNSNTLIDTFRNRNGKYIISNNSYSIPDSSLNYTDPATGYNFFFKFFNIKGTFTNNNTLNETGQVNVKLISPAYNFSGSYSTVYTKRQ